MKPIMINERKTINDQLEEYLLKHPDKDEAETLVRLCKLTHYHEIIRPKMIWCWKEVEEASEHVGDSNKWVIYPDDFK